LDGFVGGYGAWALVQPVGYMSYDKVFVFIGLENG
jgi:hypothetical protein